MEWKMNENEIQLDPHPNNASEAERVELLPKVRAAWGNRLSDLPWTHFATLTLAYTCSSDAVKQQFDQWIRRFEQRSKRYVGYFMAIERGAAGHLHAHALVDVPGLLPNIVREAWRAGRSDVRE
jgi:hypothetical protein